VVSIIEVVDVVSSCGLIFKFEKVDLVFGIDSPILVVCQISIKFKDKRCVQA
jgi:hypothetical protein